MSLTQPWSTAFKALVDADPRPMLLVDCQGEVMAASPSAIQRFGGDPAALLYRSLNQLVVRTWQAPTRQQLSAAFEARRGVFATRLRLPSRHGLDVLLNLAVLQTAGQPLALAFVRPLPKPTLAADVLSQVNRLFIQYASRRAFLGGAVHLLQNLTGCDCAGIRILDDEGNIPYEASLGFPRDFLQKENGLSICRDNCVCTRAITGEYQVHDLPILSDAGSFNVADPKEYLYSLHPLLQREYRGICIQTGYKSIAAIPIRDASCVLGAIHITDRQAGKLSPEMILTLESIAAKIGELIQLYQLIAQMNASLSPSE